MNGSAELAERMVHMQLNLPEALVSQAELPSSFDVYVSPDGGCFGFGDSWMSFPIAMTDAPNEGATADPELFKEFFTDLTVVQSGSTYRLSGKVNFAKLAESDLIPDPDALAVLEGLDTSFELLFDRQSLYLNSGRFVYGGALMGSDFNAVLDMTFTDFNNPDIAVSFPDECNDETPVLPVPSTTTGRITATAGTTARVRPAPSPFDGD